MIAVVAGGVGAARLLSGLVQVLPASEITAIVNVGDDVELHGLHISPDLDTITYTLAGAVDPETGWGLGGETWQAMDALERYGGLTWFRLGDRDLATHLYRTDRLSQGETLSEVTAAITRAWGLDVRLVPATDDPLRTMVTVADQGEIGFQDYFVRLQHSVEVEAIRFEGADAARPAPGVLEAIEAADLVVVAPSNPVVSIDPVLAVKGIRDAIIARRAHTVAVSPIVAGSALKGPADRLLTELGHEPSAAGIARYYRDLIGTLVIDEADRGLEPAVRDAGVGCVVTDTIMATPERAAGLARTVVESTG